MSEKVERKNLKEYVIDYEKCWNELKEFHKYMEMIAGEKDVFKITGLMGRIELKYTDEIMFRWD